MEYETSGWQDLVNSVVPEETIQVRTIYRHYLHACYMYLKSLEYSDCHCDIMSNSQV